MKSMTQSLVNFESSAICLLTEKILLLKKDAEFNSCSLQTTSSVVRIMYRLVKNIPPVYIQLAFIVVLEIRTYCCRDVSDQGMFTSERRRN